MTALEQAVSTGMATAVTLALIAAVFAALFVAARWPRRDGSMRIPALFCLANLAGAGYLGGLLDVQLALVAGVQSDVMPAYRLTLVAGPLVVALFLALYASLIEDWPPGRWLSAMLYVVAPAAAVLALLPPPIGVFSSHQITIASVRLAADYGPPAAAYYGFIGLLIGTLISQITRAMVDAESRSRGLWVFHGASLIALTVTLPLDILREFGLAALSFPVSWLAFAVLSMGALAALTAHYAGVLDRLEDDRRAVRALNHALRRDRLTGLHSRAALEQALAERTREGRSGGLLFLDLDHFKAVNDRYGHRHGDHLLQAAAEAIQANMRDGDLAARWGGDEFVVLVETTDPADAHALGQRLADHVRAAGETRVDPAIGFGTSVGFVPVRPQADVDAMIEAADNALYQAKTAGRGALVRGTLAGYVAFGVDPPGLG